MQVRGRRLGEYDPHPPLLDPMDYRHPILNMVAAPQLLDVFYLALIE